MGVLDVVYRVRKEPETNILAVILLFIPILLVFFIVNSIILSRKAYACPSCGHVFRKKWYELMFKMSGMAKYGDSELRLKCPYCGKTDFCKHTHTGE
jgi:rubredoxin